MFKSLLVVLCLGLYPPLFGQVVGSGKERASQLYVGAEYSRLNPDYWAYPTTYMNGVSVYGGYNLYVRPHAGFGLEGTWRTLLDRNSRKEDSFLASGRYFYRVDRFAPFVKGGGGFGYFKASNGKNPNVGQDGFHLIGAIGAGMDVRMTRHLYLRPLEWEQQVWSFSPHLLGPHSYNFGAAWRFR
ncbi:MAG TPA: outer membrane beta-barrel protein [Alloacidobacterium sp.]|jgi:opacity protein-like surface antigen|nr:outer membrane beta-barrel protein [Alloacidobacterium sp.]